MIVTLKYRRHVRCHICKPSPDSHKTNAFKTRHELTECFGLVLDEVLKERARSKNGRSSRGRVHRIVDLKPPGSGIDADLLRDPGARALYLFPTKALAQEVASRGITVNCVAPGFIQTAMTDALDEGVQEEIKKRIPLADFGNADEIAGLVLYLASPAARYITGQVMAIDGGMTM